jgi:hypothetical protein
MYISVIQTVSEHFANMNTLCVGSIALPSPLQQFLDIERNW